MRVTLVGVTDAGSVGWMAGEKEGLQTQRDE